MTVAVDRELAQRKKKTPTETCVPLLVMQCKALGLPTPVTEWVFHPTRLWRIDLAFPDYRVGVEIQGGGWINGRHSRGLGMEADAEKMAEAILRGWRIFTATPRQVKKGVVVSWLQRLIVSLPKPTHTQPPAGGPHVATR